jgi:predicted signal transduction protein with EAL and GGDEF domain
MGDTAATLLERADAALYDAKRAGRNCIRQRSVQSLAQVEGPLFEQNGVSLPRDEQSLTP